MLTRKALLPFLLPLSVILFEPDAPSAERMQPFLVIGALTLYTSYGPSSLIHPRFSSKATASYTSIRPQQYSGCVVYVVAHAVSLLFSKIKDMVIFGVANLAILLIVMAVKRYAFTSLWCAYAAVASVIILAYFWTSSGIRPFKYAASILQKGAARVALRSPA